MSIRRSRRLGALVPMISRFHCLGGSTWGVGSPSYSSTHSKLLLVMLLWSSNAGLYSGAGRCCVFVMMLTKPVAMLSSISVSQGVRSVHAGLRLTSRSQGLNYSSNRMSKPYSSKHPDLYSTPSTARSNVVKINFWIRGSTSKSQEIPT
jgi:hypothetical protein